MMVRTVALEYLKIKKSWEDAQPKAPALNFGGPEESASVSWDGSLSLTSYNEDGNVVEFKFTPEQALAIAQFIREVFTDFSTAARLGSGVNS